MPNHVLQLNATSNVAGVAVTLGSPQSAVWITSKVAFDSTMIAWLAGQSSNLFEIIEADDDTFSTFVDLGMKTPGANFAAEVVGGGYASQDFPASTFSALTWYAMEMHVVAGTPPTYSIYLGGSLLGSVTNSDTMANISSVWTYGGGIGGGHIYLDDFKVGTTRGASDLFSDDFEGSLPGGWNAHYNSGIASIISDPVGSLGANFTGTPTTGDRPLTVSFTDASSPGPSGPITAWAWTFGDGGTSSSQNPTHTYTTLGTYTVTLTVTGTSPDGTATATRTSYISVTGIPDGRVLIAFDDGPLEPSPTWTVIDQAGAFPDQFVSGYDTHVGRQTLLSQTDTGTATVYINDHNLGLFDPRNTSSPYFGKLDGRQILLQLYNPVTATWEPQFQGWIDDITWDIDGSASDANGDPINASIKLDCVDVFDFLAGFGLTPGLAGITPPTGMEDGVYYAEGHVDDRLIEILTDVGIDSSRYGSPTLASGNVRCRPVKYDPDESALTALRDAADAEIPFIANIYTDRFGKFQFRGRYGRFDPDTVSSEPGSDWDFARWAAGDEAAIIAEPWRAQMRELQFARSRGDIINAAVCYPQDIAPADMPGAVYADTTSITAYGKHDAPPMSDLLTADDGLTSGNPDAKTECFNFAKLLVLNKKDPRESLTAFQVKAIHPDDYRAATTWAFLTRTDISHIVNIRVGYPSGTGFAGTSPDDDYYIEGRSLTVRPLNPTHDYVELNLEVSPAVWSMNLAGVFPAVDTVGSAPSTPTLTAAFSFS